jgi:hypothetical protein
MCPIISIIVHLVQQNILESTGSVEKESPLVRKVFNLAEGSRPWLVCF